MVKNKRYYEPIKAWKGDPAKKAKIDAVVLDMIHDKRSCESWHPTVQKYFGFGYLVNAVEEARSERVYLKDDQLLDLFWSLLLGYAEDKDEWYDKYYQEKNIKIDDDFDYNIEEEAQEEDE